MVSLSLSITMLLYASFFLFSSGEVVEYACINLFSMFYFSLKKIR